LQKLIQDQLYEKYFEAFNFYFSKPINEILANMTLPHVAQFKDLLFDDPENEYLKRYYKEGESAPRVQSLTEFYQRYKETRPNLCLVNCANTILKRN